MKKLFNIIVYTHASCRVTGNAVAMVGRFEEQTSKGYMWYNIGLGDWFFDADTPENMERLTPTVLKLANDRDWALTRTMEAKAFVEKRQKETMKILLEVLMQQN